MQGHSIHLLIGSSVMVVSFLLMTCFGRSRGIFAIGLAGSLLHLMSSLPLGIFNAPSLFLDLSGVALMCIPAVWMLCRSVKWRHA